MNVERYKMPQPEKWLSEHEPWTTLAIFAGTLTLVLLIAWLV